MWDKMHQVTSYVYIAVVTAAVLCGCTASMPSKKDRKARMYDPVVEVGSEVEGYTEKEAPFKLYIVDELNDGEMLFLKAELVPKVKWDADNVVVLLRGLNKGEVISEKSFCFYAKCSDKPDYGRDWLEPEVGREFSLSIPAKGISDYQLEVLWGDDAKAYRAHAGSTASLKKPFLRKVEVYRKPTDCGHNNCPESVSVRGEIFNPEEKVLRDITLGAGFIWVEPGKKHGNINPSAEQKVELSGVDIAPGHARSVEITLDKLVPVYQHGRYEPVVRVISYRYK
ncbi:MAG: hypothetical protein D6808_05760 [Candidatus Dadabacteria bacterium]|nr:MAG: hypothetical protein D6808_05760 [Candidatus Dadabacteria bacterium]